MTSRANENKAELNSENLAAAVKLLIELAVEFERFNDLSDESVDKAIYKDLFDLDGAPGVLKEVINDLLTLRERRASTVRNLRLVRFIHGLCESYPPKLKLPAGARTAVQQQAVACGLEITEAEVTSVLEALARQPGVGEGRALRIYETVSEDRLGEKTLSNMRALLKPQPRQPARRKVQAGRFKFAEQMDVAFYEGEGGTASLELVLNIVGAQVPVARERALAAWKAALKEQLHRALGLTDESGKSDAGSCRDLSREKPEFVGYDEQVTDNQHPVTYPPAAPPGSVSGLKSAASRKYAKSSASASCPWRAC
jgi:hypothetical protein